MTPRKERLLVLLTPAQVAEIDALRRVEADIPPRAEMIRRLIDEALRARTAP